MAAAVSEGRSYIPGKFNNGKNRVFFVSTIIRVFRVSWRPAELTMLPTALERAGKLLSERERWWRFDSGQRAWQ